MQWSQNSLLTFWRAANFEYLQHLVPLKRDVLLGVQLRFFALEYGSQTRQFRHDTTDSPIVHCLIIMASTKQEFRSAVPNRHHHLVTGEERLKRFIYESSQTKVTNLYDARRCDENIRRLQVTVEDMTRMQVEHAV